MAELEDGHRLLRDIDVSMKRFEKWQIVFNPDKCEVMHCGLDDSGQVIIGGTYTD